MKDRQVSFADMWKLSCCVDGGTNISCISINSYNSAIMQEVAYFCHPDDIEQD